MSGQEPAEILVVDHTPESRILLTTILQEQGYRVRPVASGTLALHAVALRVPDMILLDVQLPDLDSAMVYRQIKEDVHSCQVPVLLMSPTEASSDIEQGGTIDATDYIRKPLQASAVLSRVKIHLDMRRLQGEVEHAQVVLKQYIQEHPTSTAHLQHALHRSEERLALVLEASPQELFDVTVRTGTVTVYRQNADLPMARPQEVEMTVSAWSQQVHPDDRERVQRMCQAYYAGQVSSYRDEFRLLLPNGDCRWVLTMGKCVEHDAHGHPLRIVGVNMDITERKRTEASLTASLREKECLLQELHHRVKNNLQIIASLLELQANSLPHVSVREALQGSQNRVRTMAIIHEQLYRTPDLSRIDLAHYIKTLIDYLWQSYPSRAKTIRLQSELPEIAVTLDTAIPCGLIINELVTNSLKHAFPAGQCGTIHLRLDVTASPRLRLQIADDGLGLPGEIEPLHAQSLGLRIVTTLVRQLHGSLDVCRTAGTTYTITFRIR